MEVLGDFVTSVKKAFDEIDSKWESYGGLVICGTHAPRVEEVEKMIQRIEQARKSGIPFLGICHGHQLAAIEYARNVLLIKDATSEEYGHGTFVVKKRSDLKVGLHEGESYWNNYEVVLEGWDKPKFFFTTQSHPEYQSSIDLPHPLLVNFLNLCRNYKYTGNAVGPQR